VRSRCAPRAEDADRAGTVSVTWTFISVRFSGSKFAALAWSSYLRAATKRKPNLPFSSDVTDFFSPPTWFGEVNKPQLEEWPRRGPA